MFDRERAKAQCEAGYHSLMQNVAMIRPNGLHTGTYFCQHCSRHFRCEEFKPGE